ncbi:hypothetical protein CPB85DRAFT_1254077 [Mucidula mucida]|nr:hypothetical protein CPB85DRAFT_1254077 [Mucidula mucida]
MPSGYLLRDSTCSVPFSSRLLPLANPSLATVIAINAPKGLHSVASDVRLITFGLDRLDALRFSADDMLKPVEFRPDEPWAAFGSTEDVAYGDRLLDITSRRPVPVAEIETGIWRFDRLIAKEMVARIEERVKCVEEVVRNGRLPAGSPFPHLYSPAQLLDPGMSLNAAKTLWALTKLTLNECNTYLLYQRCLMGETAWKACLSPESLSVLQEERWGNVSCRGAVLDFAEASHGPIARLLTSSDVIFYYREYSLLSDNPGERKAFCRAFRLNPDLIDSYHDECGRASAFLDKNSIYPFHTPIVHNLLRAYDEHLIKVSSELVSIPPAAIPPRMKCFLLPSADWQTIPIDYDTAVLMSWCFVSTVEMSGYRDQVLVLHSDIRLAYEEHSPARRAFQKILGDAICDRSYQKAMSFLERHIASHGPSLAVQEVNNLPFPYLSVDPPSTRVISQAAAEEIAGIIYRNLAVVGEPDVVQLNPAFDAPSGLNFHAPMAEAPAPEFSPILNATTFKLMRHSPMGLEEGEYHPTSMDRDVSPLTYPLTDDEFPATTSVAGPSRLRSRPRPSPYDRRPVQNCGTCRGDHEIGTCQWEHLATAIVNAGNVNAV